MGLTFTRTPRITATADELWRNDQVFLYPDEMPYLVDSVKDTQDGKVEVTYSSGDVIEYAPDAVVTVRDPDA